MMDTLTHIDKMIVIGDRILLKPKSAESMTRSGLLLPPSVTENEKIQSGYVIKVGPGFAVAPPSDEDEPWKSQAAAPKYIPLQAEIGDVAIYLQNQAHEIQYEDEKYIIVPQQAVLLLIRED
jgi:co-chaperonin GroES (HSP10)